MSNISMSQTNGTIRIGNFFVDFTQVLGKGATGYVYRGYHQETHEPVAVKAIQMSQVNNQVTQYLLEGEKKAMNTIKNPFVVKTHEIVQQKDYCYIIMELCSNGTLKDQIQRKGKLTPQQAIELFRKIVIGYTAVIDLLFIHRDLKTANILLRSNGDPVIIDFGYCQMIMGKRPMIAYNVGSPSYMSPEAHSKNRYSQKSDIWSLGVILHQMLTGKTLDNGLNIKEFFRIIESEGKVRIHTQCMTTVCIELLEMALEVDPERRATIHKLKYIIDKSMIPQMQAQLKKAHTFSESNSSRSGSTQELRWIPPAHFNYGPAKESKQKDKKAKIESEINYLRSTDHFSWQNQKSIPPTPTNHVHFNLTQQKNQQSMMYTQLAQNMPPQVHPILRKSLQRNTNGSSKAMMSKMSSFKEIDLKTNIRKVPIIQKAASMPQTFISNNPTRIDIASLRMI